MPSSGDDSQLELDNTNPGENSFWKKVGRWAKRVGWVLGGLVLTLAVLFVVGRVLIGRVEPEIDRHVFAPWGDEASFIQTSAGETHVLEVGEGEVILLIHGSTGSIADWRERVVGPLAESYRVVAFDSFGFGLSERSDSLDYGYPLWTQQAMDVLDALGIDRAVVVGHSAGLFATAILAAQNPDRFRGAVLTGHGLSFDWFQLVPVIPGIRDIWAASQPIIGDAFSDDYLGRAEEVHSIRGTRRAYLTFVRNQYSLATLDYFNGSEVIEIPVLQMHGEDDTSIPIDAARDLSPRIANSRFVAIDGSDHFIHIDAPDRWIEQVTKFVESLPQQRARFTPDLPPLRSDQGSAPNYPLHGRHSAQVGTTPSHPVESGVVGAQGTVATGDFGWSRDSVSNECQTMKSGRSESRLPRSISADMRGLELRWSAHARHRDHLLRPLKLFGPRRERGK